MTYQEAYDKLAAYDQTHVLQFYDSLTDPQKEELLAQIEATDLEVIKGLAHKEDTLKGTVTPLNAMEIDEINESRAHFTEIGLNAIKEGKIGAVLLAGGMGTRLGSDDPKGMYNIGVTKELYIFECLIRNLLDVVKQADAWIPLFIMTSEKNNDATVSFLKEHDFFGYNAQYVAFFKQEMAPATDYEGRIYMEDRHRIATSPNGNGGWFISMERCGMLEIVKKCGVEWLNVFAVDNVLQRIADPCFVGAVLEKGCAVGAKVVRKNAPDEKVGVVCLADGHPSIVEYYELSEEMMNTKNEKGEPAYNFGVILNYLFREKDLEELLEKKLPLHIVEKKIPYMDKEGNFVKPEAPNGYKFENLVLDLIRELDSCLPYEVVRNYEFAPIKNKTGVDSVDSARGLLKENGVEL